MPMRRWWERAGDLPGAPRVRGLSLNAEEWGRIPKDVAAAGGRLLSLWAVPAASGARTDLAGGLVDAPGGARVYAAFLLDSGVLVVSLPVDVDQGAPAYAGLEATFPAASRMQRAAFDLTGVRSSDPDQRSWLGRDPYPFVRVEGEGVHEIAVGPVHAGIIEPGHFRFSVVGEKVLRLEEHLGYVHKGIERRFTELPILQGHRLAARVSGDSAVAFSWAYCQALEGISGCAIPPRASWLRALLLELERIANHLGDLGALGNDAGFAFGLMQFSRLKEELLRVIAEAFGQRYLLDAVIPGGVRVDLEAGAGRALAERVASIARSVLELRDIYDEHEGVRDRFAGTGRLEPELATRLGVLGLAGRASGQSLDLRADAPCSPYDTLEPTRSVRQDGDVAARVAIRFEEIRESCRLVGRILAELPTGAQSCEVAPPAPGALGVGLIEGWRGPVLVALEAGEAGTIRHCRPHDPSWQSWPALEHAVLGNIVPDFPLINKSFNLSYSGVDL